MLFVVTFLGVFPLDVVKSKTIPGINEEAGLLVCRGICCTAPGVTAAPLSSSAWPWLASDPSLMWAPHYWASEEMNCSRNLNQQEGWGRDLDGKVHLWKWVCRLWDVGDGSKGNYMRDVRMILPYSSTSQTNPNPACSLWCLRATCTDIYFLVYSWSVVCIFILHFF